MRGFICIFFCKLYIRKHFARMLNSRAIKFANISENKVHANNSEFTVLFQYCFNIVCLFLLCVRARTKFEFNRTHRFTDISEDQASEYPPREFYC